MCDVTFDSDGFYVASSRIGANSADRCLVDIDICRMSTLNFPYPVYSVDVLDKLAYQFQLFMERDNRHSNWVNRDQLRSVRFMPVSAINDPYVPSLTREYDCLCLMICDEGSPVLITFCYGENDSGSRRQLGTRPLPGKKVQTTILQCVILHTLSNSKAHRTIPIHLQPQILKQVPQLSVVDDRDQTSAFDTIPWEIRLVKPAEYVDRCFLPHYLVSALEHWIGNNAPTRSIACITGYSIRPWVGNDLLSINDSRFKSYRDRFCGKVSYFNVSRYRLSLPTDISMHPPRRFLAGVPDDPQKTVIPTQKCYCMSAGGEKINVNQFNRDCSTYFARLDPRIDCFDILNVTHGPPKDMSIVRQVHQIGVQPLYIDGHVFWAVFVNQVGHAPVSQLVFYKPHVDMQFSYRHSCLLKKLLRQRFKFAVTSYRILDQSALGRFAYYLNCNVEQPCVGKPWEYLHGALTCAPFGPALFVANKNKASILPTYVRGSLIEQVVDSARRTYGGLSKGEAMDLRLPQDESAGISTQGIRLS